MKFLEWTDDWFSGYLRSGVDPVTPERQRAMQIATDEKRLAGHAAALFNPNEDTYFVCTDPTHSRYTCVLGWNHALLLRKADTGYIPLAVYCHGIDAGHEAYGRVPGFQPLPRVGTAFLGDPAEDWTIREPPGVTLERLVTYGVSSCSFAVLFNNDMSYVAVSHMSGGPTIPVGDMIHFIDDQSRLHLIASVFPQHDEQLKFTGNRTLTASWVSNALVLQRGHLPDNAVGADLYPQLGHSEIGLRFSAAGRPPVMDGILGLDTDNGYSRLLPSKVLTRLRAFGRDGAIKSGLLFTSGAILPALHSFRDVLAKNGFALRSSATLDRKGDSEWALTSGRRVYRIVATTTTREEPVHGYALVLRDRSTDKECARAVHTDEANVLSSLLDSKNPSSLPKRIDKIDVNLSYQAQVQVLSRGHKWLVEDGDWSVEVVYEGTKSRLIKSTKTAFYCDSEPRDIVEDVVRPLREGEHGFGELHTAVFRAIRDRLRSATYRGFTFLSTDLFRHFEEPLHELAVSNDPIQSDAACARMLGRYLDLQSADHPYAKTMGAVIKKHRYEFEVPLKDVKEVIL